jgi:putative transposase
LTSISAGRLAVVDLDERLMQQSLTEDQRWTLPRVVKLVATMFHVRCSGKGVSLLLYRMGWTPQMPSHRAIERDEAAIVSWRRHRWPAAKGSRAD